MPELECDLEKFIGNTWHGEAADAARITIPHSPFRLTAEPFLGRVDEEPQLVADFPISVIEGTPIGPFKAVYSKRLYNGLRVFNQSLPPHKVNHPHVSRIGCVCFGNLSASYHAAWQGGDLGMAADIIGILLKSYNGQDCYIKMRNWDKHRCISCDAFFVARDCGCSTCKNCRRECRYCRTLMCCNCECEKFQELKAYFATLPDWEDVLQRLGKAYSKERYPEVSVVDAALIVKITVRRSQAARFTLSILPGMEGVGLTDNISGEAIPIDSFSGAANFLASKRVSHFFPWLEDRLYDKYR